MVEKYSANSERPGISRRGICTFRNIEDPAGHLDSDRSGVGVYSSESPPGCVCTVPNGDTTGVPGSVKTPRKKLERARPRDTGEWMTGARRQCRRVVVGERGPAWDTRATPKCRNGTRKHAGEPSFERKTCRGGLCRRLSADGTSGLTAIA